MKHKVCFRRLIKLKYNAANKNLIATGYTNFLTQFSVSLNNLVCAYVTIVVIVIIIVITIIIIITSMKSTIVQNRKVFKITIIPA